MPAERMEQDGRWKMNGRREMIICHLCGALIDHVPVGGVDRDDGR
jgi:hypothetical protein